MGFGRDKHTMLRLREFGNMKLSLGEVGHPMLSFTSDGYPMLSTRGVAFPSYDIFELRSDTLDLRRFASMMIS